MYAENHQTNEFILRDYEKLYMVTRFTTHHPYLKAKFEIRIIFYKSLSIGTETSNVIISFQLTAKPGGRVNNQIQLNNTSNHL